MQVRAGMLMAGLHGVCMTGVHTGLVIIVSEQNKKRKICRAAGAIALCVRGNMREQVCISKQNERKKKTYCRHEHSVSIIRAVDCEFEVSRKLAMMSCHVWADCFGNKCVRAC